MPLQDSIEEMLHELVQEALRAGAEFCDARAGAGEGTRIMVQDGRVHESSTSSAQALSIRVLLRGGWGIASTERLEPDAARETLRAAISLAKAASEVVCEPGKVAEVEPLQRDVIVKCQVPPSSVPLAERVKKAAELEERARKHHKSIVNTVLHYRDATAHGVLVNSFGTVVRWNRARCLVGLQVTAASEETRQTASNGLSLPGGWEVVRDMDPDEFSGRPAQRAVELLEAAPAPSGPMTVIMDPEITGLFIHEAFGHNCEADLVWSGTSIVAGKRGQKVAAECVTVIDDPTLPGHNGSYEVDDEGVPAQRHVLVQDGVLVGWLHSLETAALLGERPNGAGRAESVTATPIPRMSNTFVAAGDAALDDLIAEVESGVYLIGARHGYVDPTRGHFNFFVETGYEIENGKLGRQIRNCALTGYTLETLLGVLGVSREFKLDDRGMCGKAGQGVPVSTGGPHVLVREMTVGGLRS